MNNGTNKTVFEYWVRRGLSRTILVFLLIFFALPLILVSCFSYKELSVNLHKSAVNTVLDTLGFQEENLKRWFETRLNDLDRHSKSGHYISFMKKINADFKVSDLGLERYIGTQSWNRIVATYGPVISPLVNSYDYKDIILVDKVGDVLFSSSSGAVLGKNIFNGLHTDSLLGKSCWSALKSGQSSFSGLPKYGDEDSSNMAFFVKSIINQAGDVIGLIALQVSRDQINYITQPSVANRDLELLTGANLSSEHDFLQNSSEPQTYVDGQGKLVLGAYRSISIAGVKWGIICQIPLDSVYQPAEIAKYIFITTIMFTALLIAMSTFVFTHRVVKPIEELIGVVDKIGSCKFDNNVDISSDTELGELGGSIAKMQQSSAHL